MALGYPPPMMAFLFETTRMITDMILSGRLKAWLAGVPSMQQMLFRSDPEEALERRPSATAPAYRRRPLGGASRSSCDLCRLG